VSKRNHNLKMINQNPPNPFKVCVVLQTCTNFKVLNNNSHQPPHCYYNKDVGAQSGSLTSNRFRLVSCK